MPGIPVVWQLVIAASVIAGIVALLAALSRASRHDDENSQLRSS